MDSLRQRLAVAAPPVLLLTMFVAFRRFVDLWGFPRGYLLAFLVYWIGWCLAFPVALLGPRQAARLFSGSRRDNRVTVRDQLLLWWPVVFPLLFAFIPRVASASGRLIGWSIVLGTVTGFTEEVLWRGVYISVFPRRGWLSVVYPSVGFGLWHLCPLAVMPSRYAGGATTFVLYSIALGLSYATFARHRQSIGWCAVAHAVHDSLGLGAFAYANWLA